MKSILDPSFKYVSAAKTNLRKTFARLRREQAAEKRASPSIVQLRRKESK